MRKPGRMEQLLEEEWGESEEQGRNTGRGHSCWKKLERAQKCCLCYEEGSFRGSQDYNDLITGLELPNQ